MISNKKSDGLKRIRNPSLYPPELQGQQNNLYDFIPISSRPIFEFEGVLPPLHLGILAPYRQSFAGGVPLSA